MYKYKIKEQATEAETWQQSRIDAFDNLESRIDEIKKLLRQSKLQTIKYYRENPSSYSVVTGTDLIGDYINDIETLLKGEE
jgi:hypothetical protein